MAWEVVPWPPMSGVCICRRWEVWVHQACQHLPSPQGEPGLPVVSCSLQGLEMPPGGQGYQLRPRSLPGTTLPLGNTVNAGHCLQPLRPVTPTQYELEEGRPQHGARKGQEEPHIFIVHGCQDSFADGGGIGMKPRGGKSQTLVVRA